MKEATGEANMTVITIVLITVVAAVATPLIRNVLKGSGDKACCTSAGGYWTGNSCQVSKSDGTAIDISSCTAGIED